MNDSTKNDDDTQKNLISETRLSSNDASQNERIFKLELTVATLEENLKQNINDTKDNAESVINLRVDVMSQEKSIAALKKSLDDKIDNQDKTIAGSKESLNDKIANQEKSIAGSKEYFDAKFDRLETLIVGADKSIRGSFDGLEKSFTETDKSIRGNFDGLEKSIPGSFDGLEKSFARMEKSIIGSFDRLEKKLTPYLILTGSFYISIAVFIIAILFCKS
ncbi:MAG: hypothetical protein LBF38_10940 [Deltaproteobacteria bacterium]|jgi:uncharacterized coiled-coil protein SlyX|nr:hypothetical protein [Deltaproteobacteria bacterium]